MIAKHPEQTEFVLGVDVGGTKICISSVTRGGDRLHTDFYVSDQSSPEAAVDTVMSSIAHFLDAYCEHPPLMIGVGIRGHIDNRKGMWLSDTMIPTLCSVPLKAIIEEQFKIPAAIDNDIHCAALAELYFGVGKAYDDFVYMNIGTGIAVGIISDRRLIRGESNYSGEFGHTLVDSNGDRCSCGFYGCLEPIASGNGISTQVLKRISEFPQSSLGKHIRDGKIGMPIVFMSYDDGDELARLVVNKAVEGLAVGIVNLINLLDPGAVILGGGVVSDGWLLPKVEAAVRRYVRKNTKKKPKELRVSALGSRFVGVLGAACLGWETLYNQELEV